MTSRPQTMVPLTAFARRVHERRLAEGYNLRQLGTLLGVSFSTLARLERGAGRPDRHTRMVLEHWLDPTTERTCACARCVTPPPDRLAQLEARVTALEYALKEISNA